jgi:DNA-binding HxlR family transcriptional regulator
MVPYRKSKALPPPCPLTACLRFMGGAWTPNVLWYLRAGPRRFSELRGDLRTVSAKVLAARLRKMEADGLVQREVRPTSPPTVEYSLTDLGQQLEPVLEAMVQVSKQLEKRKAQPPRASAHLATVERIAHSG